MPAARQDGIVAVGDLSLPDPDAMFKTLAEQRRGGLDALLTAYRQDGQIRAGIAEDYHFLLWDEDRKTLMAGRDGLGVRPLFYADHDDQIVVASGVRFAIGAGVSQTPNETSIARFIAGQPPLGDQTYLERMRRLAPGSRLTATCGCSVEISACEPAIAGPKAWCAGDPALEFSRVFTEAVRKRLALPETVVAMLSGGLDSSSIAIVAADLCRDRGLAAPRTLSLVFDHTPQWSERVYIEDVRAHRQLSGDFVDERSPDPLTRITDRFEEHGGLFPAPGLMLGPGLYAGAIAAGTPIVLDGHGGDEVVSYGWGRLHALARAGCWGLLWSVLEGVTRAYGEPRGQLFGLYWLKYGPARRLMSRLVRVKTALRRALRLKRKASPGERLTATRWRDRLGDEAEPAIALAPELSPEAVRHYAIVTGRQQALALETLHAAASAVGVAPRYPFWDRDLLALCLSLPDAAKLNDVGMARWIMRQAIDMPARVKTRWDKLDFSPHIALGLVDKHGPWLDRLVSSEEAPVWRFADRSEARRLLGRLRRLRSKTPGSEVQSLWRVAALAIYMDTLEGAPDAVAHGVASA